MGALAGIVLAVLVLCGLGQAILEGAGESAGAKAFGALVLVCSTGVLIATFTLRPAIVASMNLAVVVLGYFALACTLATLTVQERDYRGRSDKQLWEAFRLAEAGLFHRILHPGQPPRARELTPEAEAHFLEMGKKLGADYAAKQRKMHVRSQQADARNAAARKWAERHHAFLRGLFRFMRATRLSNAYSAWWFIAILVLLVVNLAACTMKRLRFTFANLGFIATHLGVIVLLLGVSIGKATKTTGAFGLEVGGRDQTSKFLRSGSDEVVSLGFSVKLEAFRTDYHKELVAEFSQPGQEAGHLLRHFKVEPGQEHQLDEGRVTFAIDDVMPKATLDFEVNENPEGQPNPAIGFALGRSREDMSAEWIFSHSDHTFVHPSNEIKIRYAGPIPPEEALQVARDGATSSVGTVTVKDQKTGEATQLEALAGATATLGAYRVEVRECYADFTKRQALPLDLQYPNCPAVGISLTKDEETEQRWVFVTLDFDAMRPPKFSDLKLSLEFDPWRSPARHKFLIAGGRPGLSIYAITGAEVSKAAPLKQGEPMQLAGTTFAIMVTKALERAEVLNRVIAHRPDAGQADAFLDPSEPAIKLRVKTPSGEQSRWLLANTQQGFLEIAGGPTFGYLDNTDKKPIAWVAKLGFYEEGEKLATKIVKVNYPATYRGFMFYQEDADPERPGYAGIRVVRDPGWPVAKTGLTMVILGIVFMFYVKPFVRSKKPGSDTGNDDD